MFRVMLTTDQTDTCRCVETFAQASATLCEWLCGAVDDDAEANLWEACIEARRPDGEWSILYKYNSFENWNGFETVTGCA